MVLKALVVWFLLTCGNFAYQLIKGKKWDVALKQSLSQAVSLAILLLVA